MKVLTMIVLATAVIVGLFFLLAGIIMLVWNELAIYFGFKESTYKIAIAITLALTIVGGFLSQAKGRRN